MREWESGCVTTRGSVSRPGYREGLSRPYKVIMMMMMVVVVVPAAVVMMMAARMKMNEND
jgi:hypothetical protein